MCNLQFWHNHVFHRICRLIGIFYLKICRTELRVLVHGGGGFSVNLVHFPVQYHTLKILAFFQLSVNLSNLEKFEELSSASNLFRNFTNMKVSTSRRPCDCY